MTTAVKKVFMIRDGSLKPGGVEYMMLNTALRLKKDYDIETVLLTGETSDRLAAMFKESGLSVIRIPLGRTASFSKSVAAVVKVCSSEKEPFVLQAHLFRESMVIRLAKRSLPLARTVFRVETYIDCSFIPEWKKRLYHLLERLTQSKINVYLANGVKVSEELIARSAVDPSKIKTVYNGSPAATHVDVKTWNPDAGFHAAMIANLLPVKGHEVLFDALAILRFRGIELKVSLFGDQIDDTPFGSFGSYKEYLVDYVFQKKIRDLVEFRGFSSNLSDDLRDFQMILLTSHSEGTANAIQEAMSSRKLIVCSDVYELPYILDEGRCGFLFKAGDPAALADVLERIHTNVSTIEIEKMRDEALQRWSRLFDIDGMVARMAESYKGLL